MGPRLFRESYLTRDDFTTIRIKRTPSGEGVEVSTSLHETEGTGTVTVWYRPRRESRRSTATTPGDTTEDGGLLTRLDLPHPEKVERASVWCNPGCIYRSETTRNLKYKCTWSLKSPAYRSEGHHVVGGSGGL